MEYKFSDMKHHIANTVNCIIVLNLLIENKKDEMAYAW